MDEKNTECVIVSAFMTRDSYTDQSNLKPLHDYMNNGKKLLADTGRHIIFIEKNIFQEYFSSEFVCVKNTQSNQVDLFTYEKTEFEYIVTNNNKIFIFFDKKQMYLNDYKDDITEFQLNTLNPNKDTIEFMFFMCYKTEWMKMVIAFMEQKYNTDRTIEIHTYEYIWIDFGIKHIFPGNELFTQSIQNILLEAPLNAERINKIRIGGIWDIHITYMYDIYKDITWYFAGGVFGGYRDKIIEFADSMKHICIQIIQEKHTIMWEVNVWLLLYIHNPDLFNIYNCDHNASLIANYR